MFRLCLPVPLQLTLNDLLPLESHLSLTYNIMISQQYLFTEFLRGTHEFLCLNQLNLQFQKHPPYPSQIRSKRPSINNSNNTNTFHPHYIHKGTYTFQNITSNPTPVLCRIPSTCSQAQVQNREITSCLTYKIHLKVIFLLI